ncbi:MULTISPECIES: LPS export ABC transporter periplasmic protein LptC [unclassified Sphingomonas]|jgi:lipopolysaccharide export system protein LptC|uniref:LPS export ABC transporter periplasmic protein LptC n=1 Tax=unclassified Sphingomonas TaxID=196159 RepID=UPI000E10CF0B|nr:MULTISPECIES: LPS export ABC transporter periplasmic protein LptC [unclassified Sphingomonas]AXJ95393.1 LPS export ABC transporter periplasmic protein LptC [Sphingomonas sp. FARSPH]
MSDVALRARTARQQWAAPGSRHDRLIRILGTTLPIAIGVLAAFLVMAPLTAGSEVSFVLDKNKVEVAHERMKLQSATYRGLDDKGQAFRLDAGSAVQQSSSVPIVQINRMAADLQLTDGPATLRADKGNYDLNSEQLRVRGPIAVRAPNNYSLDTTDAVVDMKAKTVRSDGGVRGTVKQGTFSANSINANLDDRVVRLHGNARLRIVPRGAR